MKPNTRCFKNHSLLNGCLCSFFKIIFLYTSCKYTKPLIPSYWNVQKYSLIKSQWNHLGHFTYDQRYHRKVKFIFLEHFYFCPVVFLIVIVSGVSWRSRRRRKTRRLEDSDEPGKHPFDHVEPFYIMRTFSLFHRVHDGPWMATLLGLPLLHTRWYLHCSWLYPCLELCWWIVEICYSTWLRKKVSGLCMERNKCGWKFCI